jgi:hypothetical protein
VTDCLLKGFILYCTKIGECASIRGSRIRPDVSLLLFLLRGTFGISGDEARHDVLSANLEI